MTKDEGERLASLETKVDNLIDLITPIVSSLNGPEGYFVKMETRMSNQEKRSNMIFKIFGAAFGIIMIFVGLMAADFYNTIAAIKSALIFPPH